MNPTTHSDSQSSYMTTGLVAGDTMNSIGLSLTGSMSFNGSTTPLLQNPGTYVFGAGTLSAGLFNVR